MEEKRKGGKGKEKKKKDSHVFYSNLKCNSAAQTALFGILNIIWRETKARLSAHATQKSKMAGLLIGVARVLSLAFVFAPKNIKNPELKAPDQ